jgi:hypothetical protein
LKACTQVLRDSNSRASPERTVEFAKFQIGAERNPALRSGASDQPPALLLKFYKKLAAGTMSTRPRQSGLRPLLKLRFQFGTRSRRASESGLATHVCKTHPLAAYPSINSPYFSTFTRFPSQRKS